MVASAKGAYAQSDFTPLVTTAGFQMGIVALSCKGWKTMEDVIEAAKGGQEFRFGATSPKLADLAYLLGKAHFSTFHTFEPTGTPECLHSSAS